MAIFWRICLVSVVVLFQGCGNLNDITKDWSTDKLYQEAKDEVSNGGYEKAVGYYEKLETRAIGTPLGQQAQVEKAYAQYKAGSHAEAMVTLDRFMRLHPASPLVDYALYLRGLVNFNGDLGFLSGFTGQQLDDRDQKASKEAYSSFKQLTTRFPESKYTPDALARMAYILNTLAAYELHVARYYASRGAHMAAANRAQTAIADYPNSVIMEDALTVLIQAYDALGSITLRDDAKRVMAKNFPKNKLAAGFDLGVGTSQKR
jgi:outer membrane protein assembly factor BamD